MPGQNSIFERFLAPLFSTFLLDEQALRQFKESVDWQRETERLQRADLEYPNYYRTSSFHGIRGGYLTADAAVTYDPITQYVLPPGETIVRQALIDAIRVSPKRILDLACGTGSMTLMLKQAFPQAEVIGIDLSPYMLFMAEHKAKQANQQIHFLHADAVRTGLDGQSFDLVSAALLFHETPPTVSQSILRESYRLLKTGGEMLILDGNQQTLRSTSWLREIFEEPFIKAYADGSLDAWMGCADFGRVQTSPLWWMHQITRGVKPIDESAAVENQELANQEQYPTDLQPAT
jgi:ubiquinone/menaquinone biosynthesis C-methylase UbiE